MSDRGSFKRTKLTVVDDHPAQSSTHAAQVRAPAHDWSDLMKRAQDGDKGAYEYLLGQMVPYLRSLAAARLRSPAAAEDAVQDILMTIHMLRHTYEPHRPFGPWLVTIARRRIIDRYRKEARCGRRETALTPAHETFPDARTNFNDETSDRFALLDAIERLPPNQREAIRLLKLEEQSLKEASAVTRHEVQLSEIVAASRFLVIGGAGSIGQAVTREIFKRNPRVLHVVDISENNMVELVRDIRSTLGYNDGDFRTFAIDCGSREFEALMAAGDGYDYVLNLSALKHVRSEKDPFTLMRLIEVNILNTISTIKAARAGGAAKYFCVSTDKAANPVNMMGASKRIMEMFLMRESLALPISTARFANVAFSDGSLPHGFNQRFAKNQPISAPNDVRRYFVTPQESGELCLMSCILGENRDIFFPKLSEALNLTRFSDIAIRYLTARGFDPVECATEDEARGRAAELIPQGKWPVYFFASDTTGEKDFEEFFTKNETLDMDRFEAIGVILNTPDFNPDKLGHFLAEIARIRSNPTWDKPEIVALFNEMIPDFDHKETGKYLDSRM